MIDKNAIDPKALHYFRTLKSAGYAAFFVGGAVRDLLLGKTPKDFDIATNATPNQIKRLIPQGKIIGRRFRHVLLDRDGGRYEIVTFRGPVVESTEPVDDSADPKRRYPDLNQFGTAEQDALRRDFTINALFYDPDSDELVDYVGGKKDIESRMVRTIGEGLVRLKDDPIRILRAIRHKVKLGLEYSSDLKAAIREAAPDLETTSKDRIREEFFKICTDRSLGLFLEEARNVGVAEYIMPWYKEMTDAQWKEGKILWETFRKVEPEATLPVETGISLMMIPLVNAVILDSFEQRIPADRRDPGMLPDIKFFLGSDKLRSWLLRNLRISKLQTDIVLRACFYWSRMTGKWLDEGGLPKRIEGKLHGQTGALVGAYIAQCWLTANNRETPEWISSLASTLWTRPAHTRTHHDRENQRERERERRPEGVEGASPMRERQPRNLSAPRSAHPRDGQDDSAGNDRGRNRRDREDGRRRPRDSERSEHGRNPGPTLPVLDKPLVWNGPLHSPALRPIFHDESSNSWFKDGAMAYRPSGIPVVPVDKAIRSSKVSGNYRPEFASVAAATQEISRANQQGQEAAEENLDANGELGAESENGEVAAQHNPRRHGNGPRHERGGRRGGRGGNHPRHEQRPARNERTESAGVPADGPDGEESEALEADADFAPEEQNLGSEDFSEEASPGNYREADDDYIDEEPDDNIGNRIDGPPTSGYRGDTFAEDPGVVLTHHSRGRPRGGGPPHRGPSGPGGPGAGPNAGGPNNGRRRRGRRRSRRKTGPGGPPIGGGSRDNFDPK